MPEKPAPRQNAAIKVATGILASRIVGLLRQRALAHFFGVGAFADVINTALRMPNVLQNLLGEGTMSAAFIPIYSRMLKEGRPEDAGRFAGAIFGLLLSLVLVLVTLGVVFADEIVSVFASGYLGEPIRFIWTVRAVRIIFPMTGVLVLFAWALGVLNSHGRFFVPYIAPVVWNVAIMASLAVTATWLMGGIDPGSTVGLSRLLMGACYGALIGGFLQFAVQIPAVVKEIRGFRLSVSTGVEGVRQALGAFGPVLAGRGVYQISAYFDAWICTFLLPGAVAALGYAQTLFVLPISLFGSSTAAAELPELSKIDEHDMDVFLQRVDRSLRQMMFLTIPTFVGYLVLGYLFVGALFRTGSFGLQANWQTYLILVAYSIGIPATIAARLLQNVFYALRDTRTPARLAVVRVVTSAAIAIPLMFYLDRFTVAEMIGITPEADPLHMGAAGLALGTGIGSWAEFIPLQTMLRRRLPSFHLPLLAVGRMAIPALLALGPALGLWFVMPMMPVLWLAALVIGVFAASYLLLAHLMRLPEMAQWTGILSRRLRKR